MSLVTLKHLSGNGAAQHHVGGCPQNQMMMHGSQLDDMCMNYPNQSKRLKYAAVNNNSAQGSFGTSEVSILTE